MVTKAQFREALDHSGMTPFFDLLLTAGEQRAQIFELAIEVYRGASIVTELAFIAGKSEAEMDDLFRLAATL